MNNKTIGNLGEDIAVKYLENKGYTIIDRNYRALRTEVDIIAIDGDNLVFVEVKSRNSTKFGRACEAITNFKIENIVKTSMSYIMANDYFNFQVRYDVIEYYVNEGKINHIKNAFEVI